MPDIPILGQTSGTLHTDELTTEQRERLAKMAEESGVDLTASEGRKVATAFIVIIGEDGAVEAHSNIALAHDLVLTRGATPDDIYGASAVVQKDITSMETAHRTRQAMMMMGAAMQHQAQEAAIRQRLGNLKG